jgi:F420H(2)-dependent quinone reductase
MNDLTMSVTAAEDQISVGSSSPGASKKHPSFWFMNRVLNPIMKRLLRSSIGRGWGRRLALLTYQGQRTKTRHELVAMYARDGDVVWIVPGQPERKLWWRNFRSPADIDLLLAGEQVHGTAIAIEGRVDADTVALGYQAYLRAFPRIRKNMQRTGQDSQDATRRMVMVRVQLTT